MPIESGGPPRVPPHLPSEPTPNYLLHGHGVYRHLYNRFCFLAYISMFTNLLSMERLDPKSRKRPVFQPTSSLTRGSWIRYCIQCRSFYRRAPVSSSTFNWDWTEVDSDGHARTRSVCIGSLLLPSVVHGRLCRQDETSLGLSRPDYLDGCRSFFLGNCRLPPKHLALAHERGFA